MRFFLMIGLLYSTVDCCGFFLLPPTTELWSFSSRRRFSLLFLYESVSPFLFAVAPPFPVVSVDTPFAILFQYLLLFIHPYEIFISCPLR